MGSVTTKSFVASSLDWRNLFYVSVGGSLDRDDSTWQSESRFWYPRWPFRGHWRVTSYYFREGRFCLNKFTFQGQFLLHTAQGGPAPEGLIWGWSSEWWEVRSNLSCPVSPSSLPLRVLFHRLCILPQPVSERVSLIVRPAGTFTKQGFSAQQMMLGFPSQGSGFPAQRHEVLRITQKAQVLCCVQSLFL